MPFIWVSNILVGTDLKEGKMRGAGIFKKLFIFGCAGSSLLCGLSLAAIRGLLVAVAFLLQSTGSVVVAHRLSCPAVCGIFSDQGSNPGPLHCRFITV